MLTLRPANLTDVPLLRSWESAPHLMATLGDDDWQWEMTLAQIPSWRNPFIAELDSRPIGFLEIIDPSGDAEKYWGDLSSGYRAIDLWIGEPDVLGQGHGTQMMRQALGHCFADSRVHTVLVDPLASNSRAHLFYRRLGFTIQEERSFGKDLCLVLELSRDTYIGTKMPTNETV
jgi:aminoglycoside 6'-N-acetyltransferase